MSNVLLKPDSEYQVGKLVCVGSNYAKHIAEMDAEKTKEPMLFLKPSTSILGEGNQIILPNFSVNSLAAYITNDTKFFFY